jgi:hypothetical protein
VYNVAKKTTVNKSEEIRTVLAATPAASAKEVVSTLKQKGIDVNEGLVYAVKKHLKAVAAKAPKAKATVQAPAPVQAVPPVHAAAPAKIAAPSSNGVLGVGASINVAKAAAEKVGGWAVLKEIVDALA